MRNLEGNQAIIDAVKEDKTGIGYVGIAYAAANRADLKIFDIAAGHGGEYYSPWSGKISKTTTTPLPARFIRSYLTFLKGAGCWPGFFPSK